MINGFFVVVWTWRELRIGPCRGTAGRNHLASSRGHWALRFRRHVC